MAATAGFISLPMELSLPLLKTPLYMPPIYIAIALLFIFGLVPPLVFLWGLVSRLIKQRWAGGAKKPFPAPQYFEIPILEPEIKQARQKKFLAFRFWNTVLKTQILGEWPTMAQVRGKGSDRFTVTTNYDDSTNVLKIWKQKTKQLLINELIPQDKYRLFNFTVRTSIAKPKEMIIFGCLHFLEGPFEETFMQYAFNDDEKDISLRQRIMACSDETQILLQLVQEPAKYSNDQYCFLCCMKIKKKKGYMGSGQIFIDDMFEGRPVTDATKEKEEEEKGSDETIRISICFPVCSKECLMNCVKVLHEISQTRNTTIEIKKQEKEEEKKEEEEEDT